MKIHMSDQGMWIFLVFYWEFRKFSVKMPKKRRFCEESMYIIEICLQNADEGGFQYHGRDTKISLCG